MKAILKKTKDFILYHREWLLPPIFAVVVYLCISFVWFATRRPPTESPQDMINVGYTAFKAAVIVAIVGFTQGHLFGFRSGLPKEGLKTPLSDDIYDACVSLALFYFVCSIFSVFS